MKIKNSVKLYDENAFGIVHTFSTTKDIAIEYGQKGSNEVPLVRLHSQCFTGETLNSSHCDCKEQMHEFINLAKNEYGFLLYLFQEGRGIGLHAKLEAYSLQQQGADTFEANRILGYEDDERIFDIAVDMLQVLGINKIRLHTNNPEKVTQLEKGGINIVEVIPTGTYIKAHNENYLRAKKEQHKHSLDIK